MMTKVVQPRPLAGAHRAQARVPRQRVEGSMNVADVEPVATARDEDIGGDGTVEERFAAPEVVSQDSTGARMNGYKA